MYWCVQTERQKAAMETKLIPMSGVQVFVPNSAQQPISPEELRDCYSAHYQHVLRICRRFFRNRQDAEDAAAEVFLKLCRALHQRDAALPLRPWLSQVAGHHCIDKLRQTKRERSLSVEKVDIGGIPDRRTPSPLSQILRKDEQRRVREQLIRLPQNYRVALILRYYKRMSYSEIARVLNTHLPGVKIMLFRAKRYLRRNLQEQSAPTTAWIC
jgi:RNA polymerase sigma-70 factor (ECF subfamily)